MTTLHQEHRAQRGDRKRRSQPQGSGRGKAGKPKPLTADAQEKLKHYQQQIGQVTNQREYGALLKEIDVVKARIKEAEERAMQAIETVESSDRALTEQRAAFADLDQRYKDEMEKWEGEARHRGKGHRARGRGDRAQERHPAQPAHPLERLFQRTGGSAMAEVRKMGAFRSANAMWHCSACNYNVRPQIVVEIQAGSFHQCDSCKRILYWQAEATDGGAAG